MSLCAIVTVSFGAQQAHADPIAGTYKVTDAVTNCSGSPHGLWTNKLLQGDCANYFSATDMTLQLTDAGGGALSGNLSGSAVNPFGAVANINLTLSDWCDDLASGPCAGKGYKQEGGGPYNPALQDFFATLSGTIEIIDGLVSNTYTMSVKAYTVQLGIGANAKSLDEGLSTWMQPMIAGDKAPGGHWDINVDITKVPEPGSLTLLGLGLLGLGFARRRRAVIA